MTITCKRLDFEDPDRSLTSFLRGRATFSDGHRLWFTGSVETGFKFKPKPSATKPQFISFASPFHEAAILAYISERVAQE